MILPKEGTYLGRSSSNPMYCTPAPPQVSASCSQSYITYCAACQSVMMQYYITTHRPEHHLEWTSGQKQQTADPCSMFCGEWVYQIQHNILREIEGGQWYEPSGVLFPLAMPDMVNITLPRGVQCCTNSTITLCVGMYTDLTQADSPANLTMTNPISYALSAEATCK